MHLIPNMRTVKLAAHSMSSIDTSLRGSLRSVIPFLVCVAGPAVVSDLHHDD